MLKEIADAIAGGRCICAPRGLSIDARCPQHAHQATKAERARYGRPICEYTNAACQYAGGSCTCLLPGFQGKRPTRWTTRAQDN